MAGSACELCCQKQTGFPNPPRESLTSLLMHIYSFSSFTWKIPVAFIRWRAWALLCACLLSLTGCGKAVQNLATEELVLSDAVDRSLRSVDFTPLIGARCYIDNTFLPQFKHPYPSNVKPSVVYVSTEYVTSALRNQLLAAGCQVVPTKAEAEVIIEPRCGALGTDEFETTFGIPASTGLSQAAALMPTAPPIPAIPEMAVAKRHDETASAKLAIFAYDAKSGVPIWQSGISTARSDARYVWFLGVGPFQTGSIFEPPRYSSWGLRRPLVGDRDGDPHRQPVSLDEEFVYRQPGYANPNAATPANTANGQDDLIRMR